MRSVIESMVHGHALVVLDRVLSVLRDPACKNGGNFDNHAATCGDATVFKGGVCDPSAAAEKGTAAEPEEEAAEEEAAAGANLENKKGVKKGEETRLTGTQVVMGNIVESSVDKAKSEIGSLIPTIEGAIMKQELELEAKLDKAEKSLVDSVNLTVAGERTRNILRNGANETKLFVLNETHKLKLLDAAYTVCEKYKSRVEIARLFSAVEMATDPKTKHDLLVRLEVECEELNHPSSFPVTNATTMVEEVSNATNATAAAPEEEEQEPPKTMEEQVDEIESKLAQSSDIENPYDKKDDAEIQDLFEKFPRGSREKYSKEQYKWMKEAKAGSAAVRQFAQWEPRYSKEQADRMLGNGTEAVVLL
jgi:hypothetical protein